MPEQHYYWRYHPETLRYKAPECFLDDYGIGVTSSSKESDVYSVAMTSFLVCTSVENRPTT